MNVVMQYLNKPIKLDLKMLNPFSLIRKRKLKKEGNIDVNIIYHQVGNDSGKSLIRIHNSLILSNNNPNGIVRHGDLVTVFNEESGLYTAGYACGNGDRYQFRSKSFIALDYKQRLFLQFDEKATKGSLKMWPSTASESRYFYSHHHFDSAARVAHRSGIKMNCIFMVLTLVGLFNVIDIILG